MLYASDELLDFTSDTNDVLYLSQLNLNKTSKLIFLK